MARSVGNKIAEITVVLRNQEEVVKFIKHLKEQMAEIAEQRKATLKTLELLREQGKLETEEYRRQQEALTDLDNRYTAFSTSIKETVKQSKNLDVVLGEKCPTKT